MGMVQVCDFVPIGDAIANARWEEMPNRGLLPMSSVPL